MKKLASVLCLVLGATVALHSPEVFPDLTHKASTKQQRKAHLRRKPPTIRKEKIYQPADLWVRIRKGFGLPKPAPVESFSYRVSRVLDQIKSVWFYGDGNHSYLELENSYDTDLVEINKCLSALAPRSGLASSATITPTDLTISGVMSGAPAPSGTFVLDETTEGRFWDDVNYSYNNKPQGDQADLKRRDEIYQRFTEQVIWYLQRARFVLQSIERARPYLYLIVEELEKQKLPLDLALLPILESGYQPNAESVKEALGIWQFIPATGLLYGLKQNDWYDGRRDIAASTRAAAQYLDHLQKHFKGDLLLALASYNCGQGRVDKAISTNRASGLPTDFWSLELPQETKYYVPRMLALSAIFSDPGAYNLRLKPIPNQPYLDKVRLDQIMAVEQASQMSNLTMGKFLYLNPGFINGMIGYDGSYELLLPRQNVEAFKQQLDVYLHPTEPDVKVPDVASHLLFPAGNQAGWPASGLGEVIDADHEGKLFRLNDEPSMLKIAATRPTTSRDAPASKSASQPATTIKPDRDVNRRKVPLREVYYVHEVVVGETVDKIAEYYNISPQIILGANKLKPRKKPEVGQRLIIPFEQARAVDLLADESPQRPKNSIAIALENQSRSREGGVNISLENGSRGSFARNGIIRLCKDRDQ